MGITSRLEKDERLPICRLLKRLDIVLTHLMLFFWKKQQNLIRIFSFVERTNAYKSKLPKIEWEAENGDETVIRE